MNQKILEDKLSVNTYLCPKDFDHEIFLNYYIKHNIKNIGLHIDFIDKIGINNIKEFIQKHLLNISSINSLGYFTDDNQKNNKKVLEYAKFLDCSLVCLITGGLLGGPVTPPKIDVTKDDFKINIENQRKKTSKKLLSLFNIADRMGLTIGIEPINPSDILNKGHFNDLWSCLNLVRNTKHKIIVDLYHSFSDHYLYNFLKKSNQLGLLQISDVRFDKNYKLIGRDIIDLKKLKLPLQNILKLILQRKDDIKIEFEIFPNDIQNNNLEWVFANLKSNLAKII